MMKKVMITGVIAAAIIVLLMGACMPAKFSMPLPAMPTNTPEATPLPASVFYHFDTDKENWEALPSTYYCAVTYVVHNSNTAYSYSASPGSLLCRADFIDNICEDASVGVTVTPATDMTGRRISAKIYYAQSFSGIEGLYVIIAVHDAVYGFSGQMTAYPAAGGWFEAGYTPRSVTVTAVDGIEVRLWSYYLNGQRDIYIDEVSY